MTGIFEELKWEIIQLRKGGRIIGTYYCKKVCEVKPKFMQMTLSQNRRCRNQHPMAYQISYASKDAYKKSFSPRTIWNGITSLILSSPLLNCRTTAYQSSLPFCELGTNLPRPSPYEILPFWRFISKLI